jgi:hypothetical protein
MVQAGILFGYLAAFITIIIAIALGDLAMSFHRLMRARRRVTWHPIPLLAALWVLLTLLTSFFSIFDLTRVDHISYYVLIWKMAPLFLYFLAACAVLPDEVPATGVDLLESYLADRRYLYSLLLAASVLDNADSLWKHWDYISAHTSFLLGFVLPILISTAAALVAMIWRSEKWVHWAALAVLLIGALLAYNDWEITGAAAVIG